MLSVLFGLIGIVVGVLWLIGVGVGSAWNEFLMVLQGSLPPFFILVGLVALAAGISSIKDKASAKKEEEKLEENSQEKSSEATTEEKASE
ncbi:MAG: hypothetical protein PF545_00775 [Elusimicrobia bacterium]|jgi:F0F1-type ATP synthase assembly protein I|nr:hypothetical protein [Elusimicrobiota bacterium]